MKSRFLTVAVLTGCVASSRAQMYQPLRPPKTDGAEGAFGTEALDFHPRLSGSLLYDDNITLKHADGLSDLIFIVSPGITMIAGETSDSALQGVAVSSGSVGVETGRAAVANRSLVTSSRGLTIDYAAAFNFFTDHDEFNSIDHALRANLIFPSERWRVQLQQDVTSMSDAVIDVGTRINRTQYVTRLNGDYSISDLTSFRLDASQQIMDFDKGTGISSREWQGNGYVNYAVTPLTTIGLGGGGGLLSTDRGDQRYEQLRLRLNYEISELLRLECSGGLESRQTDRRDGDGSRLGYVFDFGAVYQPVQKFQVSLRATRRNQNSALFAGQNYTDTGVFLSTRYALNYRVGLLSTIGYDHLAYDAVQTGLEASRRDDFLIARFGVVFEIAPHLGLAGAYQIRDSTSSQTRFNYTDNQVSISLTWAY